jgi:flagellar biosynthesis GTPase FlhF
MNINVYIYIQKVAIFGSMLVLIVPLLASLRAFLFAKYVKKQIHSQEFPPLVTPNQIHEFTSSSSSSPSPSKTHPISRESSSNPSELAKLPPKFPEIGFQHLNYWAHRSTTSSPLPQGLSRSPLRNKSNKLPLFTSGSRSSSNSRGQLLFDVSGVLKPGIFCAIMGASGGGKTTLLSLLAGKTRYLIYLYPSLSLFTPCV